MGSSRLASIVNYFGANIAATVAIVFVVIFFSYHG